MCLSLPFKRTVQHMKQSGNESSHADLHWKKLSMLYCSHHCGHTSGPALHCLVPLCKVTLHRLNSKSFSGKSRNDLGLPRANTVLQVVPEHCCVTGARHWIVGY